VLVVPLLVDRGFRLGIVAVEHPARRHEIKRWVITVVEQFASHAALTLNNAWLRAELEQKLEENRALQAQLRSHNLELEVKVEERTQDLSESLENLRIVDEQRRRLLARLVHAEEETRKRIAEDIHDDPVQKMIATSMRIQLMRKSIADPAEREVFDQLLQVVRSSIDGMRHLIFELRPHALDQQGLGPALREYLESLKGDFEFQVDDRLDSQPPAELRVVLYRLAQEAFANAHKHAQADRVDVRLVEQDGGFLLRISDDGVGFASQEAVTPERGHLGLSSMRERAEMAGGWCRLLSLPGDGTTVEFWVPGQRPGADEHTDDRSALSIPDDLVLDPASLP
jgi:signal transduction histidine kinase